MREFILKYTGKIPKCTKILTVFNIDFRNLHKISEILVCRNFVHQFVYDGRKFGCYLMDYLKRDRFKQTFLNSHCNKVNFAIQKKPKINKC